MASPACNVRSVFSFNLPVITTCSILLLPGSTRVKPPPPPLPLFSLAGTWAAGNCYKREKPYVTENTEMHTRTHTHTHTTQAHAPTQGASIWCVCDRGCPGKPQHSTPVRPINRERDLQLDTSQLSCRPSFLSRRTVHILDKKGASNEGKDENWALVYNRQY